MAKNKLSKKYRIKVSKNGPYLVSGNLPLKKEIIEPDKKGFSTRWKEGKKYMTQENYSLCRCGHSEHKPFCDMAHLKIKFDGTETASFKKYEEQAEKINGPELVLEDAEELCATARFCDRAGGIWNLTRKSDNSKNKKLAREEACNCPSGRLVIYDKKTKKHFEPKLNPGIGITEDPEAGVSGPIWAKGGIPVESSDGKEYEIRNRQTLCRCGHSRNKPFCDGMHIAYKFVDGDESLN